MKNAQASLEILFAFAFLLLSLLILGAVATNLSTNLQKSLLNSFLGRQLAATSLNLGILYSSTNSTSVGIPPADPTTNIGIGKNLIFISKNTKFPTLTPGSGDEYARKSSIPN